MGGWVGGRWVDLADGLADPQARETANDAMYGNGFALPAARPSAFFLVHAPAPLRSGRGRPDRSSLACSAGRLAQFPRVARRPLHSERGPTALPPPRAPPCLLRAARAPPQRQLRARLSSWWCSPCSPAQNRQLAGEASACFVSLTASRGATGGIGKGPAKGGGVGEDRPHSFGELRS